MDGLGGPVRVRGLGQGGGVGQGDHHLDVVRDHVVHLPCNAGPFRHRGQRRLLVALVLQPLGPLGQPVELAAQGACHHPGQERGEGEPGEEDEGLDVVGGRVPAHHGHHDACFEDDRGRSDEAPLGLERHRVERDEERDIGQGRAGDEPLDEGHRGNDQEDRHGRPAAEDQGEDQGGHEPQARVARALDDPARAQDEERGRQGHVDQGGVAAVQGAQPLPDAPGSVVLAIVRPSRSGVPPRAFRGRSHSGYR